MTVPATLGISIQRNPFSETSQIVHFLTRDFGRIACIVKGAFREKNSFQGSIDLLVLSQIRFTRRRGRSMALLRGRKLLDHYPGLHEDIRAFSRAALMAELLRSGVQEGQGIAGLFPLLARTLEALAKDQDRDDAVILAFQGALLKMMGYEPMLDQCVECHARPGPGSLLTAYPRHGGIVCRNCRRAGREGYVLSWSAADFLRECLAADPLSADSSSLTPRTAGELWAFFEGFFQYFMEKRINSYTFIKSLDRVFY